MPDAKDLLALYGLEHNPFTPGLPLEALWKPPEYDSFAWRVESLVIDGGFALITGEPGLGKSKVLHLLDEQLGGLGDDVVVGVMERPQSALGDFYREMGELFGVDLSPVNRYGGFKALRDKWHQHIQATLFRPVLLIDEAQEMAAETLTELRILGSARFDSACLLTTVLCGDTRLPERFRDPQLAPLGSRMAVRWSLEPRGNEELRAFLSHALGAAGAAHLMTAALKDALVEHSAGNLRVLCQMGRELLDLGAERQVKQLDEKLFLERYTRTPRPGAGRKGRGRVRP